MAVPRMHDDEIEIDDTQVRRLLDTQVPQFAHLPLRRIEAWGTDHAIFRLGDDLSVRLPKIGWAEGQGEKEHRWLPVLAPHLPIEVPVPVFIGEPGGGYPLQWCVSPWLHGTHPEPADAPGLRRLAVELAGFVLALQRIDTTGAPVPPPTGPKRGGPLDLADLPVRRSAEKLRDKSDVDVDALLAVWEHGVRAAPWDRPGVWVHGDLSDGNLLVRDGRLSGAIDWNSLIAGDPAVELMVAWNLFDAPSRSLFREALGFVDDDMWLRGRAWAACHAIGALSYYRDTNPDIVARARRGVRAVLADG